VAPSRRSFFGANGKTEFNLIDLPGCTLFARGFPKNEWTILTKLYSGASLHWCANENALTDVSSVVSELTVWSLLAQLWLGEGTPSLFPPSADQGLPQPQLGKWHRPSAVTQKRHQRRPKGEAAKQRASEQPVFTNLRFERACMKMWCSLNRNSANRCREYARCGVASQWPMPQRFFGETPSTIWILTKDRPIAKFLSTP
jgi:hypothetical protein